MVARRAPCPPCPSPSGRGSRGHRHAIAAGVLVTCLNMACASAIRTPKRHEVGFLMGGAGPTEIVDGEVDVELRSARTLQAYYAYRLTDYQKPVRLDLDIPLLAVPGRVAAATKEDGSREFSSLFLVPGLKARAELTGSRVFLTGNIGAGWARFREDEPRESTAPAPSRKPVTSNSFGLAFGMGLGIQVTSAVDVRLEARGVSAKRGLSFDEPGRRVLSSMGFFGVGFRF